MHVSRGTIPQTTWHNVKKKCQANKVNWEENIMLEEDQIFKQ